MSVEIRTTRDRLDMRTVGLKMHDLMRELYPICRSITGNGFRQTLDILENTLPLERFEVPSGTRVYDWTVPDEWNVKDAWIKDGSGIRIVDFKQHNLHLVSYSEPFRGRITRAELLGRLHSLPEHPEWIPYRTSYYDRSWGFCVPDSLKADLAEGDYDVLVDTEFSRGSLTYAEHVHRGRSDREVLFSCHGCHPSLANDNLSGLVVLNRLARVIDSFETRYTYRFLIIPGTIGAITWLSQNEDLHDRIAHGLVLTGLGDRGPLTYKRSRRGDAQIDSAVSHVLKTSEAEFEIRKFDPYGYDERQYCSPGINLPLGRLSRTPHGEYPEYHTSADDPGFVSPASLADSLGAILEIVAVLEGNATYRNLNPKCEPQLGRRGIYRQMGGVPDPGPLSRALLWILNLSDGSRSLLDVAGESGTPFRVIRQAADLLLENGLIEELPDRS